MVHNYNIDDFDLFLEGKMNPEEQAIFENKLKNIADFREAFILHKTIVETISTSPERRAVKKMTSTLRQNITQQRTRKFKQYLAGTMSTKEKENFEKELHTSKIIEYEFNKFKSTHSPPSPVPVISIFNKRLLQIAAGIAILLLAAYFTVPKYFMPFSKSVNLALQEKYLEFESIDASRLPKINQEPEVSKLSKNIHEQLSRVTGLLESVNGQELYAVYFEKPSTNPARLASKGPLEFIKSIPPSQLKKLKNDGLDAFENGQYISTIGYLEKYVNAFGEEKNDDANFIKLYIGLSYKEIGNIEKSITVLEDCIQSFQKPGSALLKVMVEFHLALIYLKLEKKDEAKTILKNIQNNDAYEIFKDEDEIFIKTDQLLSRMT